MKKQENDRRKITLLIIRHGETIGNIKRLNQGQVDGIITKKGISQSKKAGEYLKNKNIDTFYISDLGRTKDTAKEIIRFHPKSKIILTEKLREQNLGVLEGSKQGKEDALMAGLKNADFRPKKGESLLDMYQRVNSFAISTIKKELKNSKKDKTVAFVTHGGPIVCLLIGFENGSKKHIRRFLPENTAISTINIYEDMTIRKVRINSIAHLKK